MHGQPDVPGGARVLAPDAYVRSCGLSAPPWDGADLRQTDSYYNARGNMPWRRRKCT